VNNSSVSELKDLIVHELLKNSQQNKLSINRKFIEEHCNSPYFLEKLKQIVEEKDFSCKAVLTLSIKILEEHAQENMPPDWLNLCYNFALKKSFPEAVDTKIPQNLEAPCSLYLKVLRAASRYQMASDDGTWLSKYPLYFLTGKELRELECPEEYKRFTEAFSNEYIYEMMKLSSEVMGYNTLDHICGVHYLALFIGRQLKKLGLPVDLGRVSGAAAGHDIGKYGCKGNELKRVPYLHYYYTDQWFKRHDINYIGHIALNHSTWDLELENLPIESLILIYSDFRVKNLKTPSGSFNMTMLSLSQSFDIILDKLDNVDDTKLKRYKKVYAKLQDFENYMSHLKVNFNPTLRSGRSRKNVSPPPNFSLLQGQEIVENIKYLSIEYNINLMHLLRDEFSLEKILQSARSQGDWKSLREYLRIFEEYSTYLTQRQKIQTLKFLYGQLIHPEDDIRRHCAELIGAMIAMFDEDYRKEIPDSVTLESPAVTGVKLFQEYMDLFLNPGHKIEENYKAWIGYSTSIMISSLFSNCPQKLINDYRQTLLNYYCPENARDKNKALYLLMSVKYIPLWGNGNLEALYNFVLLLLNKQDDSLRLCAYEEACSLCSNHHVDSKFKKALKDFLRGKLLRSKLPAENFLKHKLSKILGLEENIIATLSGNVKADKTMLPGIFLSNLKTATNWVIKKIQVEMLTELALLNPRTEGLHTAIHFCNLLKVSEFETVRTHAGEAIVKIMPLLSLEQRNEVAVELIRALEIQGYRFTDYIPHYLGQIALFLQPVELDELIDDLCEKIKQSNIQVKTLILKTVGACICNYPGYKNNFKEDEQAYNKRLIKMIGVLLNGLGDYNAHIKQVAFSVFGKEVFGPKALSLEQKKHIFKLAGKKILGLLENNKNNELLFLNNAAGLNHIYRFISDYTLFKGTIDIETPEKVAFFPGTFDPFSLSHKQIVKAIRNMGFEVYLAIDEFSWSKRTLPNLLRRKIVTISTAEELGVYLYPENYPVNIANDEDLKALKMSFPNSKVYMAVGSDVVLNASCYKMPKTKDSIFSLDHIIIQREPELRREDEEKIKEIIEKIDGECIKLTLPKEYVEISSTQIRANIDENRDISNFVDPLAQQYIYENGFYRREPQDKALLQSSFSLEIQVIEEFTPEIIRELASLIPSRFNEAYQKIEEISRKPSARAIILKDPALEKDILGFSLFHWIRSSNIFQELKDIKVAEYVRKNTLGRMILVDGIFVGKRRNKPLEQILLTETLAFCLPRDYQCAIYRNMLDNYSSPLVEEVLRLQGFEMISFVEGGSPVFVVNMANPSVLILDVETIIKEPFKSNPEVKRAISRSRKRLQEALTMLYPGHLVLSFDINVQHELMIKKICQENGVPTSILSPKKLGPAMCVPYGNILDRYVIPNTVTKALHTEKLYEPHMRSFTIGQFPHYLSLHIQAKTIRSFKRPVILVDDLLHKGDRLKAIDEIFKKEDLEVKKVIVGILSGRGKELMDIQNRDVDSVYFLPRLRIWFNENALYPFIGGDALWRGEYPTRNLLPSINFILPYTSPTFIECASKSSIYNMSKVAIQNAIDITQTLENEYHKLKGRNLTLALLGEVFISPRCPDHGRDMEYNLNLGPSHFLKNDLELLERLEHTINRT